MKITACEKKHTIFIKPDRDGKYPSGKPYLSKNKTYQAVLSDVVKLQYIQHPGCLCFDFLHDHGEKISSRLINSSHLDDGKGNFYYPDFPELFSIAKERGCFFTVWFIKKDGTERKMTCRFGVKKCLKGGKTTLDENKFFIVYSIFDKDYRAINKETILRIKLLGTTYELD